MNPAEQQLRTFAAQNAESLIALLQEVKCSDGSYLTRVLCESIGFRKVRKTTRRKSEEVTFDEFSKKCRESGEQMILPTDSVFTYAKEIDLPVEFLRLAWRTFAARARETGGKQKDWRAHFRNAVRNNWGRLWFLKDGQFHLTTAGMQEQRAWDAERRKDE